MESHSITIRQEYAGISVVENENGQYAVTGKDGREIVPFGRYAWISGFDSGLARVRTKGVRYMDPNVVSIFVDWEHVYSGDTLQEYYEDLKANHPEKLCHWGIINTEGVEVLEAKYDEVWNFLGKNRRSTRVELDGRSRMIDFSSLPGSDYYEDPEDDIPDYSDEDSYGSHFGEYAGSYAQDVMGYSDEVIGDAFDGDPDAYWNID